MFSNNEPKKFEQIEHKDGFFFVPVSVPEKFRTELKFIEEGEKKVETIEPEEI